jgi:hypothetical protein
MITHTRSYSVRSSGGGTVSSNYSESGSLEQTIDASFAAGTAGALVDVSFTFASLQSIQLVADQPMTIYTNSAGSPAQTFNLKAGMPFDWSVSPAYFANPFTVNVTAFYITTTLGTRLRGRILTN